MKKFSLKKALEGNKVVTKDGRLVTGIHIIFVKKTIRKVRGVVHPDMKSKTWNCRGRYYSKSGKDSFLDLFMMS